METSRGQAAVSSSGAITSIAVIGGGRVGSLIASMLSDQNYTVTLADAEVVGRPGALHVDATDELALARLFADVDAVVSCLPYDLNAHVARAAHAAAIHYFDPTEDVLTTRTVSRLATTAKATMVPQCGVAPGFICIVAAALASRLDEVDVLTLRAGGLPRNPTNALGYAFTWSPDGVINEYLNPCEVLVSGKLTTVPPLQELERVMIEGTELEAFTTSGGNGTLCTSFANRIDRLNYKTLRYPGHRDLARFLLSELGLGADRRQAAAMLERAYPAVDDDVIYLHVAAQGRRGRRGVVEQFARAYRPREFGGAVRTAIGWTTACGVCGVVELVASGKLGACGLVRQEDISLESFAATRAGAALLDKTDPTVMA